MTRHLLFALTLIACTKDKAQPVDTGGDTGATSTADDGGGGTTPTSTEVTFSDLEITPAEAIPTVLTVRFSTDGAGQAEVRFGVEGEAESYAATATDLGDGSWEATIVGLPADAICWIRGAVGEHAGAKTAWTTEAAPSWVDKLESSEGSPTPGFVVVGLEGDDGNGALILDTRGRPVWWSEAPEEVPGHLHTRARLSPDRTEVWYNAFGLLAPGADADGQNAIIRTSIDGSEVEVLTIPYAHHDFVLHEDGTLAWLDVEPREVEGATVRGARIVERAPDGTETDIWTAWNDFTFTPGVSPEFPESWWTLANHMEYLPETDHYAVSMRNLDTIVEVDRQTGTLLWSLGPEGSYVPDSAFDGQHGFDVLDDGILLFDNGSSAAFDSRAARFHFEEDGTATMTWEYHADPALYSFVMGDAQLLDNGNTWIMFSTVATSQEVDEAGTVVASFVYEPGIILGFAERWDSLVR